MNNLYGYIILTGVVLSTYMYMGTVAIKAIAIAIQ
jgi:hypothetical protein